MRKTRPFVTLVSVCLSILAGCTGGNNVAVTFSTSAQALDNGQSVTITVTVKDSKNAGVTWTLSGPGALSNQAATSVTYTAPASGSGTATVTATSVTDKSKSVNLTIMFAAPPAITTTSLPNGIVGTAYNQTVAASGGAGTLTFTVSVGTLPAGLSISSAGAITGTPTTVGKSTFTVKVTDGSTVSPQSATQQLSITVNAAPAFSSANSVTFVVGTAGTFTVTATGTPTPSLTEGGALPSGVTFVDNGNGTGTLSGTPAAGTAKNYAITFTASNGVGTAATQNFTLTVGQPAAITSANKTTFTVGTAGTFSVTTTGFPAPSLTETGTLPSGVTFVDNGNGSATLAGTPAANTGGTYAIAIKAHNGIGTDATQSFTLTVNQTPAITSANKTTFTVSAAGTFTVTTSGFPVPSITETGALPTGVTFVDNGNGTGTLAGVPAPGTAGNYPITFTPSNGVGSPAGQSFTLTVGQAPTISSGSSTTFTVGTAGTFTVTTTGFPAPALTETGALPSGVTFMDNGNGTATLAGTPAAGTGKTYSITITASNGVGSNATQNFTLTVDQAPAITSANSTTFSVGAAGTFTVTTTGFPTASLTETGTLPGGVTFVDNGNGTGKLSGTPGSAGTFPITFTASNGVGSNAAQNFTLTVNTAPVITSATSTTFTVGTNGSFTVTATGTPTPAITESGTLPTGVTFTGGTGTATLSGTPAANTGGTYTLTFTASNGVGTNATQTFTLTVDQAPVITSPNSTTFTEGVMSSFTVMTTGFPKPSIIEGGALPGGVTFTDNGNGTGTLAGTPASGSSTGSPYSITFTANNAVGTPFVQTFTLTVNTAPVVTSANSTTFTAGTPGTFTVMATGTPTPAITESGTLPSGVTFTGGTGTATLSGTPAAGTGGTYSITFTATSSSGTSHQTFTLTVDEAPTITSANSTTFTVGTNGSFTVTTTGFPKDPITETGTLPSGVTLVDNGNNTATLSGTPAAGTAASYPIIITASNGVLPNATQNFTLTVNAAGACTTSGGSESLLNGGYAFLLKGFDSSNNPALVGGVLTFNGSGTISAGAIDMNLNSGVQSLTVTSGTYGVGSDHRGCMAITTSAGTQHYAFSVANISGTPAVASTAHVINFDSTGPFTAGTMLKQSGGSFSNASVSGSFAFGGSSIQNTAACTSPCKFGIAGIISFNGSGGITSGSEDINQNGILDGNNTLTAYPATSPITFNSAGSSYNIASNGRGTLTIAITGLANAAHSFLYAVSSSHAFFMTSDAQTGTLITGGEALQQSGTPFATNPLSGTYIGYDSGLGKGGAGTDRTDLYLIGPLTSGSNALSGNQYRNDGGTFASGSLAGQTYSSSTAGRIIGFSPGGGTPVLYLVSTSQAFLLAGNGSVDTGFIQSQSGTSASGTYAFGGIDPEDTNVGANSGVVTLSSGNITGTSDNNSSGGLQGNQAISTTYSVDANGLGHIPSGCTPGTNCQLIFLVVSPTRAILTQLQHSGGTTQTSPAINPVDQ